MIQEQIKKKHYNSNPRYGMQSFIFSFFSYLCMDSFKFDPSQTGLRKTLKEYEEIALRYIWSKANEGARSSETYEATLNQLGSNRTISRASVVFFLNRMVEQGVLSYRTTTGIGGHRRIYYPEMDENEYKKYILKTSVQSMLEDFPKETKEALKELNYQQIHP